MKLRWLEIGSWRVWELWEEEIPVFLFRCDQYMTHWFDLVDAAMRDGSYRNAERNWLAGVLHELQNIVTETVRFLALTVHGFAYTIAHLWPLLIIWWLI